MERIQWKVQQIIDAHGHFRGLEPLPHYYGLLDLVGHTKVNVLGGTTRGGLPMDRKREFPRRFYCFGCLEHDPAKVEAGDGAYLVGQVGQLLAMGYDGLKMMEGKPAYRKALTQVSTDWMPLALDHRYFYPLWDRLEELDMPITMHLADPLDWWTTPDGAYRHGYEPQEEFFRQAIAVLERRPRLRITFAHFMFMGPQLDRLGDLFARFPQMRVDLAMGHEFLYYLSDDPQKARAFFITWQDRILYGTDISDRNSRRLARAKAETLRLLLETDGTFVNQTSLAMDQPPLVGSNGRVELHGLDLPQEVLEKVLARNFEAFAGAAPKPLP